jgi:hypothetical protein
MELSETIIIDQITVLDDGQMLLRTANIISRDGVEIAKVYHREVIRPGQDVSGHSGRVRDIASVVHSDEVIKAFLDTANAVV